MVSAKLTLDCAADACDCHQTYANCPQSQIVLPTALPTQLDTDEEALPRKWSHEMAK
jgi:hypothetical protein